MVSSEEFTVSKGLPITPRLDIRRKMVFNQLKTSLFPTEKQKREARGERVNRRGVASTTIIHVDVDMPPYIKERRTRQILDPDNSVR